jgi:muramoyltetrapeptide carboxypeptidase
MLLAPPALVKGDTIYILSTARKITRDEIAAAVSAFEAWGLKVVIGKTVGLAEHQYAGTDKERLEDFQYALDNPEIKAVICARGGYGTVRIMDDIVYDRFMQSPKWIVGFSDITYLHTHISNTLGVQTIHSIMPVQFPTASAAAVETLRQTLFGEKTDYRLMPHELNRRGSCEGILIGGNLSILYSITGTKSGINTMGKILFLEDIDEYLYHIDRMMINLKRSGKLQGLAGIIAGSFTEIKDNAVPFGKDAFQIIAEHVHGFEYPVCFGFPAGHLKDNCALRIGKTYSLQVKDNEVLIT